MLAAGSGVVWGSLQMWRKPSAVSRAKWLQLDPVSEKHFKSEILAHDVPTERRTCSNFHSSTESCAVHDCKRGEAIADAVGAARWSRETEERSFFRTLFRRFRTRAGIIRNALGATFFYILLPGSQSQAPPSLIKL